LVCSYNSLSKVLLESGSWEHHLTTGRCVCNSGF